MIDRRDIQPVVVFDRETARSRWNVLNRTSVCASAFTSFDFVEALASAFGWSLATVFWGDDLGACFVVRRRGLCSDIVVPPLSPYSCIALSGEVAEKDRETVLLSLFEPISGLPQARIVSLDPRLMPYDIRPSGYQVIPKSTYVVETGPLEQTLKRLSNGTRRVFKAENGRYRFQPGQTPLPELGDLVDAGYRYHGKRSPLSSESLAELANAMVVSVDTVTVGMYETNQETLNAGIVLLKSDTTAWYWLAGSVRGPSMTVLLAYTIQYLHSIGIQQLDLMGANTDGISEFKRRFGGELVTYRHYVRIDVANKVANLLGQMKRSVQALMHP